MEFDAVVVGSGIAGCVSAYYLAKDGFSVCIINNAVNPEDSNTYHAQGGIVFRGKNDSPDLLYEDIMSAGAGISNPDAARIVADESESAVEEVLINKFGVEFSKDGSGLFDLTEEAAHSSRRILHAFDSTGRSIEEKAVQALENCENLTFLTDHTVIDIITLDHHSSDKFRKYQPITSMGVYAADNKTGKVIKILSKIVVLASGGLGQIYLHTTNPVEA
ncbi:MAG: FAD-dependent oxidoreductase, partial [Brevinematales bacterium]